MVRKVRFIFPLIALILVSGSVNAFMGGGMGANDSTGGYQPMGPGGQGNGGPRWEGTGSQRPLDRGFSFNGKGSGPEVAVVDNGSRGVSMALLHVEFYGQGRHLSIDVENLSWGLRESTDDDGNITMTYAIEHDWSPEGPAVNLTSTYKLAWEEGARLMRFRFHIDRVPGEGILKLTYRFRTESAGNWGTISWRSGNGGLVLGNDREGEVCEVGHAHNFTYAVLGERETGPLTINGTAAADEGLLTTEGSVRSDITSAELEGTLTILDTFISALGEVVEEGIDYVMDHLVSFLIGGALTIAISSVLISVTIFRRRDGPDGLVLDRNPYYRGPKGPGR